METNDEDNPLTLSTARSQRGRLQLEGQVTPIHAPILTSPARGARSWRGQLRSRRQRINSEYQLDMAQSAPASARSASRTGGNATHTEADMPVSP